jgi:TDG/mug DNA glycosylase family protein
VPDAAPDDPSDAVPDAAADAVPDAVPDHPSDAVPGALADAVPGALAGVTRDGNTGDWRWRLPDLPADELPLVLHVGQRRIPVGTTLEVTASGTVGADRLARLLVGAGLTAETGPVPGDDGALTCRVVRARTLADTVGPGMRLLICGVNPSPYSADAGVGYARPGNRFWPAALAAGVVPVDRDPVAALAGGTGMTDFAKRPTRTAAEVTRDEYRDGFARVAELVGWLRPGAVCFVGLSGWRTVVDRAAVAGPQPTGVGDRPVYVMPSTSGLNARTSLDELAHHLAAARVLGAPGPGPGGGP